MPKKEQDTVKLEGVVTEVGENFFYVKVENPGLLEVTNRQDIVFDFITE